ncbi:serine/threonine-protein kinase [Granulicella sp. dw_53]|uniref:serine/threonine-protein kinase n=1 Tax=Granulicella sp. dw_53 TaxID=2719792 RepID=UPI002107A715|nr:serine/threonine-protein kinase [Granulicella sp. dw_53]
MSRDPLSASTLTRIGRYDIVSELGRGGMGIVYKAEDKLIGREIAIKTLTETTPELRERFYVEARSGMLNHANIVTIYELGEHEGNPYIAMEFVAGESLEKIFRSGRRTSLVETLSTIEQLCSGLGYAHQNGVLHRDIKPANLIIQPDGKVKIVDFGIARLADQTTRLTKTDALIGTFHYIAPERLKGELSDGRADIWSAGVMLYQMITGQLPFDGTNVSTLYKVISEPYTPLRDYSPDLPDELIAVVERALAKNAEDRYSTAEEMAFDLRVILDRLKKERVGELTNSARRLIEEGLFANARMVLLDLQRIDSQDIDVRRMMREVQDQLNRTQKTEQLRQFVEQADEAIHSRRYEEAVLLYRQAIKLDTDNVFQLAEQLNNAQSLKDRQDKVNLLQQQAGSARERGDLISAQDFLSQALTLDEKDTGLRNAYAAILREVERSKNEGKLQKLLQIAREDYTSRRYTETISGLREAAELDPTHPEVQKLLHEALNRQDQELRRKVSEQVAAEVQDCLHRDDFDRALRQLNRALEKLPTEASLLRLKVETEKKKRDFQAQQIAHAAAQEAQDLFSSAPKEALAVIEKALEQVPGAERLVQLKSRLEEHIQRFKRDELLAQCLKQAHVEIDAMQFDNAVLTLESALIRCGESEDVMLLLEFARAEQQVILRRRQSSEAREEAQALISASKYEAAIAKLEPVVANIGDAELKALLEHARQMIREASQRLEAVTSRTRSLAATDLQEALRFLESQPPEIIANSQISALLRELTQEAEIDRAIQAAVASFDDALGKNDWPHSLDALEAVHRKYGDSNKVGQSIGELKNKRLLAANASLTASIDSANEALARNDRQEAREVLRRSESAAPFAGPEVRADRKRLLKVAAKNTNQSSHATGTLLSFITKERFRRWLYITAGLLVVIIATSMLRRHRVRSSEKPVFASTYLELNALPWAVVQQIADETGHIVALPSSDHNTPLRLEGIPVGNYTVTFVGVDKIVQMEHCQLTQSQHLCTSTFPEPDIKQLLVGDQP